MARPASWAAPSACCRRRAAQGCCRTARRFARALPQDAVGVPKEPCLDERNLVDDDAADVLHAHTALAFELFFRFLNLSLREVPHNIPLLRRRAEVEQREQRGAAERRRRDAGVRLL